MSRDDIRDEHLGDLFPDRTAEGQADDRDFVASALQGLRDEAEPAREAVWGVIVETRRHPALDIVIRNVADCSGVPIQLFHGRENLEYIMAGPIAGMVDAGDVVLTPLEVPETIGVRDYNALLLSPQFWRQMKGRGKILTFQCDSLFCPDSVFSLADFMDLDYVGSAWNRRRPVGLLINGGSGGFSIRDWPMSVAALERFSPARWPTGEDGFFAFHLELMGAAVASMERAAQFSSQADFTERSFGAHRIGMMPDHELAAFMAYCPKAREVFPHLRARLGE